MKKLTEEKIQQMVDLYNDGNNFTEIGKIIGLSADTVSKYLKDRVKKRVGLLDRYTEEQLQDICKIYKDNGISKVCKLRSNGMPVPLLRNGYSIFNGTKYR